MELAKFCGKFSDFFQNLLINRFKKTTNGDNYNRDDPCKAADNVFLSLKQWIELFTKNCRNGKHFQKQVDKVEEERDRFFTNFANPVCTWYKTL